MTRRLKLKVKQTRGPKTPARTRAVFSTLSKSIDGFTVDQTRRLASAAANAVRQGILKQRLRHKALKKRYRKWKIAEGLDPRILVATGDYVRSIAVLNEKFFGKTMRIRVGVKPGKHYSGLTYNRLGKIHEYGASWEVTTKGGKKHRVTIPPRPHFRRVYNKMQAAAREHAREGSGRLIERVRDHLRRYWE